MEEEEAEEEEEEEQEKEKDEEEVCSLTPPLFNCHSDPVGESIFRGRGFIIANFTLAY